jgi:hypothetical protein
MSETPRQLSDLLTILADNTVGAITPEDIRDMLVSLYPSRGQLTLQTPANTTFASSATYVPLAGVTVIDTAVCSTCVTMPANGVLKLSKAQQQIVLFNATLEVLPAGNNKRYTFTVAKNGTPIPSLAFTAFWGNLSGNPAGVFLSGLVPTTTGDELQVVVRNDTDTTAIQAAVLTTSVLGVMV